MDSYIAAPSRYDDADKIYRRCGKSGIPQDSRMALGGSLTKDSLTPELIEYLRKLNAEAAERGETLVTDSIKWVLEQEGVTSVIVGARTPEQFSESLKCLY